MTKAPVFSVKKSATALPVGRLYRSSTSGTSFAVLTVPLRDRDRRVWGTATIVIPCDSHTVLRARLDEMTAVMALVHELSHVSRMPTSSSDATQSRSDLTRIAKSTEYGSIQEFAFAFANTLKTKLDCEQVSLGIARGSSIQLLCISGSDVLYPHAPGAAVIVHAMQECLDAQQVVCFQLENERGKGGGILGIACIVSGMKRWHRPAWPAYRWFSMVVAWLYWDCVGEGATIF